MLVLEVKHRKCRIGTKKHLTGTPGPNYNHATKDKYDVIACASALKSAYCDNLDINPTPDYSHMASLPYKYWSLRFTFQRVGSGLIYRYRKRYTMNGFCIFLLGLVDSTVMQHR